MRNTIHAFGVVGDMVCYLNVSMEFAAEQYLTNHCKYEVLSVEECIDKYYQTSFEFKNSFNAYAVF